MWRSYNVIEWIKLIKFVIFSRIGIYVSFILFFFFCFVCFANNGIIFWSSKGDLFNRWNDHYSRNLVFMEIMTKINRGRSDVITWFYFIFAIQCSRENLFSDYKSKISWIRHLLLLPFNLTIKIFIFDFYFCFRHSSKDFSILNKK